MLFTTFQYFGFFVLVWAIHWLLPQRVRRLWLLIASYYFYTQAFAQYGFLIGALTLVNYAFGLALGALSPISQQNEKPAQVGLVATVPPGANSFASLRRPLLVVAIVANLGTLAFFKYTSFLFDTFRPALRILPPLHANPLVANIILPLGISFFTFEFIHYVVEVYRGQPPMRNPIDFALFAAFFPTQIAGPIKRFPDWVKQLRTPTRFRDIRVDVALGLILRGVVKKVVVADMVALIANSGFERPDRLGFLATWFTIYAFAAQIYADFSGYTDIGRGCALLLGYSVPENFNRPYQARNPSEFWDRWHISLSRWLRDYLFIPLGGSRVSQSRLYLNLLITMALGGLWHGASWHFMVWGIYQGGLLVGHRLWARLLTTYDQLGAWAATRHGVLLGQIITFHAVCLGWVLFRADTQNLAEAIIRQALTPARHNFTAGFQTLAGPSFALPIIVLIVAALVVVWGWLRTWIVAVGAEWRAIEALLLVWLARWEPVARPVGYLALLVLVAIWPAQEGQRFIYFQF